MPVESTQLPPLHRPGEVTTRPKGILKNPSFSGASGQHSPHNEDLPAYPSSTPLDPQESKDITIQNTIQNAGHRRSSSAARRASASRRHSSSANASINAATNDDESEKQRLKWDEANLYLAEQESGGRMKITEPKTPYQYGDAMDEDDGDGDVAIDPRYVNVDEMDMAQMKKQKSQENEIPGLDIGEAEDSSIAAPSDDRILRGGSLSRESSKDKHVSVSGEDDEFEERVGMPTKEEQDKHQKFEEQRKKHYEMRSVKGLLGHPEDLDNMDEDDSAQSPRTLTNRDLNGV